MEARKAASVPTEAVKSLQPGSYQSFTRTQIEGKDFVTHQ
jgi:hypothetical protein